VCFVLKTNDTTPAWKYRVARLQEQAMTGIGLTLGHGDLHFFSISRTPTCCGRLASRRASWI